MESTAEIGGVHISKNTHDLLMQPELFVVAPAEPVVMDDHDGNEVGGCQWGSCVHPCV